MSADLLQDLLADLTAETRRTPADLLEAVTW